MAVRHESHTAVIAWPGYWTVTDAPQLGQENVLTLGVPEVGPPPAEASGGLGLPTIDNPQVAETETVEILILTGKNASFLLGIFNGGHLIISAYQVDADGLPS